MTFRTTLDVRYGDQDINGHVNNVELMRLVEEARVRASAEWFGTTPSTANPRVIRAVTIRYDDEVNHGPGNYSVDARVWVTRVGTTSFTLAHEISQRGRVCVFAEATIVVLDPATRKPAEIPPEQRELLQRHAA